MEEERVLLELGIAPKQVSYKTSDIIQSSGSKHSCQLAGKVKRPPTTKLIELFSKLEEYVNVYIQFIGAEESSCTGIKLCPAGESLWIKGEAYTGQEKIAYEIGPISIEKHTGLTELIIELKSEGNKYI